MFSRRLAESWELVFAPIGNPTTSLPSPALRGGSRFPTFRLYYGGDVPPDLCAVPVGTVRQGMSELGWHEIPFAGRKTQCSLWSNGDQTALVVHGLWCASLKEDWSIVDLLRRFQVAGDSGKEQKRKSGMGRITVQDSTGPWHMRVECQDHKRVVLVMEVPRELPASWVPIVVSKTLHLVAEGSWQKQESEARDGVEPQRIAILGWCAEGDHPVGLLHDEMSAMLARVFASPSAGSCMPQRFRSSLLPCRTHWCAAHALSSLAVSPASTMPPPWLSCTSCPARPSGSTDR